MLRNGSLRQHGHERRVGANAPGKDLRVLHLPGHDGMRRARLLEQADARAKLADGNPVDRRAGSAGGLVEILERLSLVAITVTW